MCGIIGYTGRREAEPILVQGLRRLEHRDHEGAGLATVTGPVGLHVRKCPGRIADLATHLQLRPAPGCSGIAHTRRGTHGPATEAAAHPHVSFDGKVAVVHNGFIQNHTVLRRQVRQDGIPFRSDTDTEVVAHLLACHLCDDLLEAVRRVLPLLKGTYGLAVVSPVDAGRVIAARFGSPLVLGIGDGEYFLASEPAALIGYAREVVHLQDNQIAELTPDGWHVFDQADTPTGSGVFTTGWEAAGAGNKELGHHLIQEIMEQPESLADALRGRLAGEDTGLDFGGLRLDAQRLRGVERLVLTGSGSSYHAALVSEYLFEEFARLPVEVEYASEFRHRNPPVERNALVVALSQSGETADTLAALREARDKGHPTLALCNVVDSTIAREADGGVYLHAGPENGVASTKAFTSQVLTLALLALHLGRLRHLSRPEVGRLSAELAAVPDLVRGALACEPLVQEIAEKYAGVKKFLFLGRRCLFPVALEGALKLKEVSSIHAQGYPATEQVYGRVALLNEGMPAVLLAMRGPAFRKVLACLGVVKSRGGPVIAVTCEGDEQVVAHADHVITVPAAPEYLQALLAVVPLQLLAYHIARLRGRDADLPGILANGIPAG